MKHRIIYSINKKRKVFYFIRKPIPESLYCEELSTILVASKKYKYFLDQLNRKNLFLSFLKRTKTITEKDYLNLL